MNAEYYNTTIKPLVSRKGRPHLSENGAPLFEIRTQSFPVEATMTVAEFRDKLVREGRIWQPLKWATRIGWTAGLSYLFASNFGLSLPSPSWQDGSQSISQAAIGIFLWLSSQSVRDSIDIKLSKWDSRKYAFETTFHEKIRLIPEKFHPRHLLGRFVGRSQ